jgi:hypothetical protein
MGKSNVPSAEVAHYEMVAYWLKGYVFQSGMPGTAFFIHN